MRSAVGRSSHIKVIHNRMITPEPWKCCAPKGKIGRQKREEIRRGDRAPIAAAQTKPAHQNAEYDFADDDGNKCLGGGWQRECTCTDGEYSEAIEDQGGGIIRQSFPSRMTRSDVAALTAAMAAERPHPAATRSHREQIRRPRQPERICGRSDQNCCEDHATDRQRATGEVCLNCASSSPRRMNRSAAATPVPERLPASPVCGNPGRNARAPGPEKTIAGAIASRFARVAALRARRYKECQKAGYHRRIIWRWPRY